jgi:HCOMODA/2-hydroxy-3-carboxy-muconic semialdehyde decarboxylase
MTETDVTLAARALARHRLVHAYGHVSARVATGAFVVTPAHPLGRVQRDTGLVVCPIDGALPAEALPEVRAHQAIYRVRVDVRGICRFQSPHVIALSAVGRVPRALHGLGAYFAPAPPLWDDPALVRDPERAAAVADRLGGGRAIVLRGNGAIAVGASVREAACHAFFLEDAARIELLALATGAAAVPYTAKQAAQRAGGDARLYDRMWEYLLDDDVQEDQR